MIAAEKVRRLLGAAEVTRSPYAVADAAAALLVRDPTDAAAIVHYLRALATLGLGAAAGRVLTAAHGKVPPEILVPWAEQLAKVPAGLVPWASRRRRFQANLRVLAERWPAYANLAQGWEAAASRYELHQAADGNYQILDTHAASVPAGWRPVLDDHRAATSVWKFDKRQTPRPAPIAFDGLGHGWLLPIVATTTANSFLTYSCALYVIEPDPVAFCITLHLQDLQDLLRQPRLRVYVGPEATDRLAGDLRARPDWISPRVFIANALTARPKLALDKLTEQIDAERTEKRAADRARIKASLADKDARYWLNRYRAALSGQGPPLRVLGLTTRFSTVLRYSIEELQAAVRASGHQMEVLMEPDDHTADMGVAAALERYQPDLLVLISRMRHEDPALPPTIPFLCWDQDNLPCMRTPQTTASLNPLTYVAGHGATYGLTYLGWPEDSCISCHLAAATHRYAPRQLSADERARYGCDFSYVSNASGTPDSLREQLLRPFPPEARRVLLAMTEEIRRPSPDGLPWHDQTIRSLLDRVVATEGVALSEAGQRELRLAATTFSDRYFRHETLGWVSGYCRQTGRTMRLYGAGWEQHPTLAEHAAGVAQPGPEVQAIYQATRINLQIIETGILHSRFLDGVAGGGFFLLRRTLHESGDAAILAPRRQLGEYLQRHPVASLADLDRLTDPAPRAAWQALRARYMAHQATAGLTDQALLRSLRFAADCPHALEVFPNLDAIAFASAEEFGRKAEAFLADEALRSQTAANLRQVVQEHFSYDARWQTFITRIVRGLARACGEV